MKIIIIGAGFTGMQLAKQLVQEEQDVVLIDKDRQKIEHTKNSFDCTTVEADGNNIQTLHEVGISSADALVALTDDDETNMITCALVEAEYPDILKIARVRNYAYYINTSEASRRHLEKSGPGTERPLFGIDVMLSPEVEISKAICRAVVHGAVGNIIKLGRTHAITTIQVEEDSPIAGIPLRKLSETSGWKYLVVYIEQAGGGASLPGGDTLLSPGDHIGVLSSIEDLPELVKTSSTKNPRKLDSVSVFGADRVGMLVSKRLLDNGEDISSEHDDGISTSKHLALTVIDRDYERCREASEQFADASVMCGDITDANFIEEENIDKTDLMVAASGNFESNLVIAAYFKSRGVGRTIALTASSEFNDVANKLGIDVAVPMRDTVVDAIISHLRGKNVKSIHSVCNRKFEIVECGVAENSKAAGRTLKQLSSKAKGRFLALLVRSNGDEDFSIPNGETTLDAGTHVVLIIRAGDGKALKLFCG